MIPKEKIEELREKADLVALISEYVPLKKRGKNYLGLCPFHAEKTPSFTVSPEKGFFHCFGCGEGGNAFAFIMKMEKVDFPEAAEILGNKLGIHIERTAGSGALKTYKEKLLDLMFISCKFFESRLDENSRAYLVQRGLKEETVKTFRLGYAPDGWHNLFNYLTSRGAKTEDLEAVGLILPQKEGAGFYDRFRSRLMFPIFDLRSRVIGFSGRTISNDEPKYLNSPDSVIFQKGENLFGLNFAKEEIKKRKFALLVEGNVDVLSLYEAGFPNVVAPLGTALTASQAKLLARFAEYVILAFDADAAGLAASERAQELLTEAGLKVRIMDLGKFKDPDEFIKACGKEALIEAIKKSSPAMEFKVRRVIGRYNLSEIEARARAAHEVADLLSRIADRIAQHEYLKLAARLLGVEENLLTSDVNQRLFYKKSALRPLSRQTAKPPLKIIEAEKTLVRLAIESEEALNQILEGLAVEDFTDPNYREIIKKLKVVPASGLMNNLESEQQQKLAREALLMEVPPEDLSRMVGDCVKVIKGYHTQKQIEAVRGALAQAEAGRDLDEVKKLNLEYHTLSEILRSYDR